MQTVAWHQVMSNLHIKFYNLFELITKIRFSTSNLWTEVFTNSIASTFQTRPRNSLDTMTSFPKLLLFLLVSRVKSSIFGQTGKLGQRPCLFQISNIGIKNKLTKQTATILMGRLTRSRLIWISTVCKRMFEFTWCPKLPDFTLIFGNDFFFLLLIQANCVCDESCRMWLHWLFKKLESSYKFT